MAMEKVSIALEEGKVKRLWGEMYKVENDEDEEGEEEPTEAEKEAEEEFENSLRRVYDYDDKTFNFANQRCTDTSFSRRTFLPSKTKPRIEAEESIRRRRVMEETRDWIRTKCDDKGNQLKTNMSI